VVCFVQQQLPPGRSPACLPARLPACPPARLPAGLSGARLAAPPPLRCCLCCAARACAPEPGQALTGPALALRCPTAVGLGSPEGPQAHAALHPGHEAQRRAAGGGRRQRADLPAPKRQLACCPQALGPPPAVRRQPSSLAAQLLGLRPTRATQPESHRQPTQVQPVKPMMCPRPSSAPPPPFPPAAGQASSSSPSPNASPHSAPASRVQTGLAEFAGGRQLGPRAGGWTRLAS
jgi:hypothetical protein